MRTHTAAPPAAAAARYCHIGKVTQCNQCIVRFTCDIECNGTLEMIWLGSQKGKQSYPHDSRNVDA